MNRPRVVPIAVAVVVVLGAPGLKGDEPPPSKIAAAKQDTNGILVHAVESPLQKGPTEIQVLLPARLEKDRKYPVVYVLPVEPGTEQRFGNGLREVQKLDLADKHGLIFVQPTFAQMPWYVDHPRDKAVRQETYFLTVVVPFIDKQYPVVTEAKGRLLLGFSKSGWGAFSLLLRHPDMFARASAWDAPLNLVKPAFGLGDIVGTQEHFEQYQLAKALERHADELKKDKRLALVGYANFAAHHLAIHEQLERLKIPHEYRDEKKPKHTWDAGWIDNAVQFLVTPTKDR